MKDRELEVLRHIRRDARKQFTAISRETGIPTTTVFDYYHRLKEGVIKRHVSLLDFSSLGYHFNSFFLVKCHRQEDLLDYLEHDSRVNNLFKLKDDALLLEAVFRDLDEKDSFREFLTTFRPELLEDLPVMGVVKREAFVPEED